ncbi:hypothetical protein ACFRR7_05335 [Streptomyces sp. NPDC056909]|uniref:hypothetical protein n=1 Tax=unclassified Streptomyces TaxID=2593676 RepID=UPI00341C9122|nr:hypothetical protein OG214_02080 [Streptomyces sp. NBC_00872]
MNPIVEQFVQRLSPKQQQWFERQPMSKQTRLANSLVGSRKTAGEMVRENGGPVDERSAGGFEEIK